MWAIFPLIPAIIASISTIFSATGGVKFALSAVALDQWHRHHGYASGEGVLTPRDGGYFGTKISLDSHEDLGKCLALIAALIPHRLGHLVGRIYPLTDSEGRLLRKMVKVAFTTAQAIVETAEQDPELADQLHNALLAQVEPIDDFLLNFMARRQRPAKFTHL